MKSILLVGAGRFGRHVAQKFSEMGHEVMVIDSDEERINRIMPFVTNAQIGDATNEDYLRTLGVANYDVCICAIGNDFQSSLETTSLLKELGAKLVVSRATRDVHEKFLLRNGADKVVYPEKQLGIWTAITYSSERIFDYVDLGENFSIFEVSVPKSWVGKTLMDLDVRRKYGINVMTIRRNGKLELANSPDTVLEDGTTMYVIGETKAIQRCFDI